MSVQIHTKTGRETFLCKVADTYCAMYPERAEFFKRELGKLRQVTGGAYKAGPAGEMYCKVRVPTELWLFIQRWCPDFGKDSSDLELLARVWCDLVPASRDKRARTTFFKKGKHVDQPNSAEGEESAGQESVVTGHDV